MLRALVLRLGIVAVIDQLAPSDLANDHAWRELEGRLRPFVARRVRDQADVDDVIQEVFVRIQRALGSLRDEQRFGPWVYQITRSAVIDHLRSAARRPNPTGAAPTLEHPTDDLDPGAIEQEVARYATFFIAMLPSPYREALTLTELEGMTQKEASRMLGISLSGMKSRVQRGRQKLRAALEDCCHIALDARKRVIGCEPRLGGTRPPGCCGEQRRAVGPGHC